MSELPPPSLSARRRDFLMTVGSYMDDAGLAHAEGVLDALIAWSTAEGGLEPTRAGTKQVVAFRTAEGGPVVWSAHPRHGEEPALLLLPTLGLELEDDERARFADEVTRIHSRWPVESSGAVTVPFSSLIDPEARQDLTKLLEGITEVAGRYG